MGMTHGQSSLEVPKIMRLWYGSGRCDTRLTGNTAPWSSSWRSCWHSMAYQMVLGAYLDTWVFPFAVRRPYRSMSPCELELSMCAWPITLEMSWLPHDDPHSHGSFVISTSSTSMCWRFFCFPYYIYLDNWIKPLIRTGNVSQIMIQITVQFTLHTCIWST